jgi:hypothetical protein
MPEPPASQPPHIDSTPLTLRISSTGSHQAARSKTQILSVRIHIPQIRLMYRLTIFYLLAFPGFSERGHKKRALVKEGCYVQPIATGKEEVGRYPGTDLHRLVTCRVLPAALRSRCLDCLECMGSPRLRAVAWILNILAVLTAQIPAIEDQGRFIEISTT